MGIHAPLRRPVMSREISMAFDLFVALLELTLLDSDFSLSLLDGPAALEWDPENPMAGHSATAAEALYFALGGPNAGLVPCSASWVDEHGLPVTHWWLQAENGALLDPTRDQFDVVDELPPYDRVQLDRNFIARFASGGFHGLRRLAERQPDVWGFGRRPSPRATALLERMRIRWRLIDVRPRSMRSAGLTQIAEASLASR